MQQKISLKKEYKRKISNDIRKVRAHKLITKGALLEILGMEDENNEVLLGFFSTFVEEKREEYKRIGEKIFSERKKEKKR
ncbi:conjugal transfer protein TraD [Fusobacterium necrophorum]|uniref:conjugal transfer protein TraD n=1 Tax=Fusobacterium necrophorum TaxID=859 RepID=UPI0021C31414|nr:conjugal transfer protein TraD [Fusobacterium necrophorum]MDK4482159.1 conjugal transfer protein TraD [Fusobacterium necrophorum]MDK4484936.1 conjugal transfer protein TraD [Fusobacterium necrophorum]MDK4488257.1 conjugal transfer protein TraD [Fusobacterium necrophorum]MDK4498581.1 conjugal transfer protein TraD [Fusobacterium necrophorum]MDK4506633.1 conjugal transfer protein TraD [Fusobacterium necrophorum]